MADAAHNGTRGGRQAHRPPDWPGPQRCSGTAANAEGQLPRLLPADAGRNGATEEATLGQAAVAGDREPWEAPCPLGHAYAVPAFPVDVLPPCLAAWVRAEAEATQTPPDLAAMLALDICGAGLAGKFRVMVRPGWDEPLNLFVVVALPPGDRKSAVFAGTIAPVVAYEREEQERMAPVIAQLAAEHRVLERRLKLAEDQAAQATTPEAMEEHRAKVKDLAAQLAAHHVPELPRLFCDDETTESLGKLLAEQKGRVLQASAEGTALEIAKGRYSEKGRPNFDVYLKGHAGDPLRVGRVSRGRDTVERPALSVALAVQPDVIRGLAEHVCMGARGFLARFLYSLPRSRVGRRTIKPPPVPAANLDEFQDTVLALWRLSGATDDKGQPAARWLEFSSEADRLLEDFEHWLEPQLAEGEELSHLAGWANKLAGAVARIAGVLHMAGTMGEGQTWNVPISAATVAAAIRLGRDYLLPHALAAFGLMGTDERLEDARAVAAWLGRNSADSAHSARGGRTVSKRDIHNAFRRRFKTANAVDPVLTLLVEAGYLRPVARPKRGGPGHPPSPRYEVNPLAAQNPHNAQNSPAAGITAGEGREPGEEG